MATSEHVYNIFIVATTVTTLVIVGAAKDVPVSQTVGECLCVKNSRSPPVLR
jgi:hypothetical protein